MQHLKGYSVKETLFKNSDTEVYRALRESDGCSVILRTYPSELNDESASEEVTRASANTNSSRDSRLAFTKEVLGQFDHPNIVKVIDWLEDENTDDPPYLVMEDIQGIDLWQYAETFSNKQVPLEDFLKLAIQLADALSVIHHAQIIHKDLHPGNMIVNAETGQVQIIDFGLASLLSREQPAMAAPDKLEGILAYISPEQTGRMNRALDYRSDFYTLGITFYNLLAGSLPFSADDALGMVYAHMAVTQTPVGQRRKDVPQVLSNIADKLMHKNAESRYQSALGLKHDLERCLESLKIGVRVADSDPNFTSAVDQGSSPNFKSFELGEKDISSQFIIPQVLYGREQEVQTLMKHFHQAAMGSPQVLAVAGYSGIGKSALVHEVHKPIAAHSGLFLQGKFDQFQQNVPYSALKRALNNWLQHALSLKKEAFHALRQQLLERLGKNARVLVDFMDDFKRILYHENPGDLAAVPELGAEETQNRFYLMMQRFIKFTSERRPLVIFIDDLQWADRGTLNLLPQVLKQPDCRLLVIVAYRDNEVDDSHPAIQMLHSLASPGEAQVSLTTLNLAPLPATQVVNLLQDTLHRDQDEVEPLAELLIRKTDGNPFFSKEFLKKLYAEKLINFELDAKLWTWQIDAIEAKDITDNVVELMLGKMQDLPEDTQALMRLAACVGTYFDVETLAMIAQKTMPEVARALWPALQQGLLIQEGGDWFLGMLGHRSAMQASITDPRQSITDEAEAQVHGDRRKSPWVPRCKFLHDRMLQAAYESLEEPARQAAHLSIGRMLLQHYDQTEVDAQLFTIIEQLNHGRALIEEESEATQLARLNLQAAEKAKQSSVWGAVLHHAEIGISLLPKDHWQKQADISFALHFMQVESEFLLAHHQRGQKLADMLIANSKNDLDKAHVCLLLASQQTTLELNDCIDRALEGLSYCGLSLPARSEVDEHCMKSEQQALQKQLNTQTWDQLSEINNQRPVPGTISFAYRLFAQLAGSTQIAGQPVLYFYCVYKGLRTVLEHGADEQAIVIFAMYSGSSAKQANYNDASKSAKVVFRLLEHYPHCADAPYAHMSLGTFVWHFHHSLQEAIALQVKAYEMGKEYGDIVRGVLAGYSNALISRFAQGEVLSKLKSKSNTLSALAKKHNVKVLAGNYYKRLFKMLGEEGSQDLLSPSAFSEAEWQLIQGSVLKPFIEHLQTHYLFWSDQTDVAWQYAIDAEASLPMLSGFVSATEQRFLEALLALKQAASEQTESAISRSLSELEELNGYCSENYTHKLDLLKAEIGFAKGESIETLLPLYKSAIESAKENGFLQFQALANELLARVCLHKGIDLLAKPYMKDAISLYSRWGCRVKVKHLKERYHDLLTYEESSEPSSKPSDKLLTEDETKTRQSESERRSTKRDHRLEGLDLNSVMKSAQAISGELEVKSLLATVLEVIAENSGAQHAAFVSGNKDEASVEALLSTQNSVAEINVNSQPLNECDNLPIELIQYALRSEHDLQLDENFQVISDSPTEEEEKAEIADPYLERCQPKSVLCTPVIYRDQTLGALYLENTLSANAFPQARLDVIKMLLSQVAISYENAKLFDEVTRLNTGLELKVEQRTQDLNQAVKNLEISNAELDAYAHTVSHDLRAPVRHIKNYTQMLQEDLAGQLDTDTQHLFNRIIASTSKMYELINALLELSKMQQKTVDKKRLDLSAMVNEFFEEMRERNPNQVVLSKAIDKAYVMADSTMMKSVLDNLINNAWKYSSKNPHAEVTFGKLDETASIPSGIGAVPDVMPEGYAIFFVKDNGDGFDMSMAKELFGSFKRMHSEHEFEGTGIGLATVKKVLEKHGGTIWAEAHKGEGATFYFTLPSN